MAVPKGKRRLNLTVSDVLDEKLQRLADAYGVPKASLCTMLLAQTATASEKVLDSADMLAERIVRAQLDASRTDEIID